VSCGLSATDCASISTRPRRGRRRELARATSHRQHAEEALATQQEPTERQSSGMLRWLRRSHDQPAQVPGRLAVATQQANRAHDRERELRQHQQRRDGWLDANAHLGPQYRQVMRTPWPGSAAPPA